jgi:aminoglycoside 6'-N-acetyltransferase
MAEAPNTPAPPVSIDFRPVVEGDLPLVATWLAEPHVARWWGDVDESLAEMRLGMAEPTTEQYLILFDGQPVGYIQSYDIHGEGNHPYNDQPVGTIGMDLSIGDPALVGRGYGPQIIVAFMARLFAAGAPRVVIDPDPANARAILAYAKAGFTPIGERTSIYGPALLMVRDRDNDTRVT